MRRHWILRAGTGLAIGFLVGGTILPGPLQALAPRANGLEEIAPGVFLDDPGRATVVRSAIATATAKVTAFYGEPVPPARMILCATTACAHRFMGNSRPAGRTYGARLVVVAPTGLNVTVLTHEIAHVALHARMTAKDLVAPRFPTWFDEGLASWIAGDDRLVAPDQAARARVLAARHFTDWGGVMDDLGWQAGYGAALALVEDMVAAGGSDGLRTLVDRVAGGADFDAERAALLSRGTPGSGRGEREGL